MVGVVVFLSLLRDSFPCVPSSGNTEVFEGELHGVLIHNSIRGICFSNETPNSYANCINTRYPRWLSCHRITHLIEYLLLI